MPRVTSHVMTFVLIGSILAIAIGGRSTSPATAQELADKQLAEMEGEWEITYTNAAVRTYRIDKDGVVRFSEEGLKGRIQRKSEALILGFEEDERVERLTMGMDGRLFIEHFAEEVELVETKATIMGIGIRQKSPKAD
ncbi:hypothetical protein ACYOEI_15805 [Singulisphaera rosea]